MSQTPGYSGADGRHLLKYLGKLLVDGSAVSRCDIDWWTPGFQGSRFGLAVKGAPCWLDWFCVVVVSLGIWAVMVLCVYVG